MSTEKIIAAIGDQEYSFTVEVLTPEDEATVYRVVPDQPSGQLDRLMPAWLEFDADGVVQTEDSLDTPEGREIAGAIWQAVQDQVINNEAGGAGKGSPLNFP